MRVFVIPSWYPDPQRRLSDGMFCLEQARALTEVRDDLEVHVSLWGQSAYRLSERAFKLAIGNPVAWARGFQGFESSSGRLHEWCSPVLNWSPRVLGGNITGVLKANRRNLERVRERFGKVDLIHAHVSFPGGFVAMHLAHEINAPFIITEHMGPFPFAHFERDGVVSERVAKPLRAAGRVVAVSPSLRAEISHKIGVQANVIPNMVDDQFFAPAKPATPGKTFQFFTLGAMTSQKGIDDLLRAIAQLRLPARFRIAGPGTRAPFEQLSAKLNVADRIEWLGPLSRERVREEMQACDAFVLTSRYETFGVVYAEALACGKPLIATRCGGPESIVHDGNGLLVSVGDVSAIADALSHMMLIAGGFDPMKLRADCLQRFSRTTVVNQIVSVYREMLEEHRCVA